VGPGKRRAPLRASGLHSGPIAPAVALLAGEGAKSGWSSRATVLRPGRKVPTVTGTGHHHRDRRPGGHQHPGRGSHRPGRGRRPAGAAGRVNVRDDIRVDRDFIASVRDLGVLVPIVAVRTAEGGIRGRFGHRRTRAAVVAGLTSVPVVVVADEATTTAGQVERLVTQWAENEHRTGLTLTEQVGVVGQLSAFGVSAAQIAKRTRLTRPGWTPR